MKEHKPIEKYKVELKEVATESTSEFTKINCASCAKEIPADNININDKIAKCNHCNAVFPFYNKIADFLKKKEGRQEIFRPEGLDLFYFKDELDITVQQPIVVIEWILIMLLPLILFFSFLFWLKQGVSILWPISFFIMNSLYVIYTAISRTKHKVHIVLDKDFLTIKWRPKKFIADQTYRTDDIDQIYVRGAEGYCQLYMLVNDLAGQKHIKLMSGLTSVSKARYIEQEIERYLGIENRKVPEESP